MGARESIRNRFVEPPSRSFSDGRRKTYPHNLKRSYREKTDYQTIRSGAKCLQTKDLAADRYSALSVSCAVSEKEIWSGS